MMLTSTQTPGQKKSARCCGVHSVRGGNERTARIIQANDLARTNIGYID